jgi:hypothetical protein
VPAVTNVAVEYFGTDDTYSITTLSQSGNLFGVYTDKSAGGSTTFLKKIGAADPGTG